jgi:hypothetical protein
MTISPMARAHATYRISPARSWKSGFIENCVRRTKPMRAVNPRPRALAWLFKHIHTRRLRSGADPTWLMITFANQDDLK